MTIASQQPINKLTDQLREQIAQAGFTEALTFRYYRKIAKTSRTYIKMSTFQIRVIFEILLNSIVCFLQFSSGYIQVSVIIKVDLFSGFYGSNNHKVFKLYI